MLADQIDRGEILSRFGLRVKHFRKRKRLTQEELAELGGFHRTYISLLERGKRNIGLTNIWRVARALGIPPHLLLEEVDDASDAA